MASRHVFIPLAVIAFGLLSGPIPASADQALIVKFRTEGPSALDACAEQLSRSGRSFASASRDRSGSLDALFLHHGLGDPMVLFPAGINANTLAERRSALGSRIHRRQTAGTASRSAAPTPLADLPDLSPIYRVEIRGTADLETAREALASDPHVEYVQVDHERVLDQIVPPEPPFFNDPYLASSGSWGAPYLDLWGLYQARLPEAWPRGQGEGVVVAVIDTGLDALHPDIAANVWVNPGEDLDGDGQATPADLNGIDDDENGLIDDLTGFDFANSVDANEDGDFDDPGDVSDADPTDDHGHGTHVSGTIAAVADNGIGIVGVAPRARIMALKGFKASGSAPDSLLWRAVLHAAANGASVINNSWSCGSPCPSNPLAEEVLELVEALGVVVVTSAGNRTADVAFYSPENGQRVITVGSVGADETLSEFSNRGWLVDLMAPGGGPEEPTTIPVARRNILSLRARDTFTDEPAFIVDDEYFRLAGTSMSSPHVAGAVAILRGVRPELTPGDVRRLVRLAARDVGSPGYDPEYAAGLLDVAALVDTPAPAADLEIEVPRVGYLHDPQTGDVELRGKASGDDVVDLEVAIARGLSGHEFQPLESFGRSTLDWDRGGDTNPEGETGSFVARWDVADVGDGPRALRVRARLQDGRLLDEFTLVGIERNPPLQISRGEAEAGNAYLSGRSLVWRVPDSDEAPTDHDLVLGRFPDRDSKLDPHRSRPDAERILERPGDQRDAVREGEELAWIELEEPTRPLIYRCRIGWNGRCEPTLASKAPGSFGPLFLARGWLVWGRTDGANRFVEGCRLDPKKGGCVPRPLIDPASGLDWSVQSFDGRTLLASRSDRFVRCRLESSKKFCTPEEIVFPSGDSPVEPRHDGDLMAFSRVDLERVRPPGCAINDPRPSCARRFVATVEYVACAIDPGTSSCDPIVVSDKQPVERAFGIEVSGRRIVWSMGSAEEEPAISFCEYQPTTNECPAQRIGGILAAQKEVTIDGARVAWSDGRDGPFVIRGLELPDLRAPSVQHGGAGARFVIALASDPGSSTELRHEIEGLSGVTPEEAGARIWDPGSPGGVVLVKGVMPVTAPTRTVWRVRAVAGGGLWSESVIELVIRPSPPSSPSSPSSLKGG